MYTVPVIFDTLMQNISCMWNHDGTVLAICGMKNSPSEKDVNHVMFYTPYGAVSIHPE